MKYFKALISLLIITFGISSLNAEHLIILATNDTHSQIEPAADGMGGVLRRRVVIDSVRQANKNVLLVDAGDVVQGTLYFTLFGGKVEYACLDSLGYDITVIGNHEFDSGIDSLAAMYRSLHTTKLSANYDMSATPFGTTFQPFTIREYAGKRIAFFGINVNPKGLIIDTNYRGLRYLPSGDVADATARYLKQVLKVDYTVMVSHIGYTSLDPAEPNDSTIVSASHYIDMVIGAHSHTLIKPSDARSHVKNADGRDIIIGQGYKSGKYVADYDLNLDDLKATYSLIPVDRRLDSRANYPAMKAWLAPYEFKVDSVMNNPIGHSAREMKNWNIGALSNWCCDAVMDIIPSLYGKKVQFAILNKGGFRQAIPKGVVTEGLINSMFPFDNRFVVLEITGKDLIDALHVMATKGGDATSKELTAVYDSKANIISAKLNGKEINKNKKYTFVTIDYLANGGDYMFPLKRATVLFRDNVKYGKHILDYIKSLEAKGKMINASDERRMLEK
jgi:5'-nucleotidase / UDP-sugar diphosphatase